MAAKSKPVFVNVSPTGFEFTFQPKDAPRLQSLVDSDRTPDRKKQKSIFSLANTTFISNSSDSLHAGPSQTPKTPMPAPAMDDLTKGMAALKVPQTKPPMQPQHKASIVSFASSSSASEDKTHSSSGESGESQDESSSEESVSFSQIRRPPQSEPSRQTAPQTVSRQTAPRPIATPRKSMPPTERPRQSDPPRQSEPHQSEPRQSEPRQSQRPSVSMTTQTPQAMRALHLRLLEYHTGLDEVNEIKTTPIFTEAVRQYTHTIPGSASAKPFSQYGLLAGDISGIAEENSDKRVFWNISAPSSFFICGSQGSGKSHTLSCLLENALAPCDANVLPRPLTGIVFHYDTFISDTGGSPCEAAWLSSNPNIKVRVLCPPTNIRTMKVRD